MRDMFEGDENLLRRYLLGELSEEETERLEPRLLEDDRLLEQMEAVEGDLLAEYAQGELTLEQEREVRRRLIATEEGKARLAMVRNLHRIGDERQRTAEVVPMPRRLSSWYVPTAALAAALLLTVVGASVWPQLQGRFGERPPVEATNNIGEAIIYTPTPDPDSTAEANPGPQAGEPVVETPAGEAPAVEPGPSSAPEPEPAAIEVPLRSEQRGGGERDILALAVPGNAETIVFRVPLREEGFTSYKAVLHLPDHSSRIFEQLVLVSLPSGQGIQFSLPAASVSEGLYTIEVSGFAASGDQELVGDQELEIQRR